MRGVPNRSRFGRARGRPLRRAPIGESCVLRFAEAANQARGVCGEMQVEGAKTTITLSDEDLALLASGKAEARSLFQHGKLRVDGIVTPAHHLGFLVG